MEKYIFFLYVYILFYNILRDVNDKIRALKLQIMIIKGTSHIAQN